jgi:hypothetical protein
MLSLVCPSEAATVFASVPCSRAFRALSHKMKTRSGSPLTCLRMSSRIACFRYGRCVGHLVAFAAVQLPRACRTPVSDRVCRLDMLREDLKRVPEELKLIPRWAGTHAPSPPTHRQHDRRRDRRRHPYHRRSDDLLAEAVDRYVWIGELLEVEKLAFSQTR